MTNYVYTSIALNYLGKARVLSTTVKKFHPDWKFCLVIAEKIDPEIRKMILNYDDIDEIITYDELTITDGFNRSLNKTELNQWYFKHSIVEFCTAIKGSALCLLLDKPDCEAAFYFDPDMAIFDSLDQLTDYFKQGQSILLTPHLTDIEKTYDAVWDNEISILRHGIYNLGFLGVNNDVNGKKLAKWWKDRLDMHCYADIPNGVFTDQSWFDMVPATFDGVQVLRDPQYNVATWNLTHRIVEGKDIHSLYVNKIYKLCFYHFSGFDSGAQLSMLNKYAKKMPQLFLLRDWYIAECQKLDDPTINEKKWPFNYYSNGEKILNEHRIAYRNHPDLHLHFIDPFNANKPFYEWYKENKANNPLLEQNDSEKKIQEIMNSTSWKITKPLRDIKVFFCGHKEKILLDAKLDIIFNTIYGGGAYNYLQNKIYTNPTLIVNLSRWKTVLKAEYIDKGKKHIVNFKSIEDVFKKNKPTSVTINHLLFAEEPVNLIKKLTDLCTSYELIVNIHDYFMICPTINLLNNYGSFCNLPSSQNCKNCLKKYSNSFGNPSFSKSIVSKYSKSHQFDIDIWRSLWAKLFEVTTQIVVPSHSTKDFFNRAFNYRYSEKIVIKPHDVHYLNKINKKLPSASSWLKLGIIGDLGIHKGANQLLELIRKISSHSLNITITVFGETHSHDFRNTPHLKVLGHLDHDKILQKINETELDGFLFLSICPETFSYVTQEMMATGLPIIAFNLGAQAEYLKNYSQGILIDTIDVDLLFEKVISMYNQHIKKSFPLLSNTEQSVQTEAKKMISYIQKLELLNKELSDNNTPSSSVRISKFSWKLKYFIQLNLKHLTNLPFKIKKALLIG